MHGCIYVEVTVGHACPMHVPCMAHARFVGSFISILITQYIRYTGAAIAIKIL